MTLKGWREALIFFPADLRNYAHYTLPNYGLRNLRLSFDPERPTSAGNDTVSLSVLQIRLTSTYSWLV